MTNGGEAADQIVRMSLEAGEVALKISGAGAKQLAVMLYAILKDQKKTKGRVRMETLVRTAKPLTVYSIKESDLKTFVKEAKEYGVLYCAVRNPRGYSDGMVDVIVKEEDAVRVNRIVERFEFAAVKNVANVKTEIEKSKEGKEPAAPEREKQTKDKETQLIEELFEQPIQKEGQELKNPSAAKTANPHPSEPTSKKPDRSAGGTSNLMGKRASVREELKEIKAGQKQKTEKSVREERQESGSKGTRKQTTQHQPVKKNRKKTKER